MSSLFSNKVSPKVQELCLLVFIFHSNEIVSVEQENLNVYNCNNNKKPHILITLVQMLSTEFGITLADDTYQKPDSGNISFVLLEC